MGNSDGGHDTPNFLDSFSTVVGRLTAWLTVFMVIVMFVVVVMRYVFDAGLIWMQESVTWMHATVFMIGAAYTLRHEEHVRVDIFYRGMSVRRRALVDLLGVVLFLLPFCAFLGYTATDYAFVSWTDHESSREPGGLPYPMLPLLKSVLVIAPLLLGLQGVSLALHSFKTILGTSGNH